MIGRSLPFWLAVFILLQIGRVVGNREPGRRWTTRVIVLPVLAPVARGPYRWLKHPNYLIVALEIAVVPLALGLPLVALDIFTRQCGAAFLSNPYRKRSPGLGRACGVSRAPTLANSGSRR